MQRKIRVLVGKPGLDGHDRGAKVVAAALRDAGMEVVYTGLHQTPAQIVEAAAQEDVDVVALSILSGAHMHLFPEVMKLMRERGIGDRLLTGGGIIPPEDMGTLAGLGVGRLFGPGASTQDIAHYIREWFAVTHRGEVAPSRAKAKAARPAKVKAVVARVGRGAALPRKPAAPRPKRKGGTKPTRKLAAKAKRRPAGKPRRGTAARRARG
jgi:methylmalonyl-CoA mutase C-terminal domain/subunit